jgi:ABC-type transporter MlaC component
VTAPQNQYRRRRIRRLILTLAAITTPFLLICCITIAVFATKKSEDDPARTAAGAVNEYFSAIKFKDSKRMSKVLCDNRRAEADSEIAKFYARLDSASFTLETLSWIPTSTLRESKNSRTYQGVANLTVRQQNKTRDLNLNYQVTVTHDGSSWDVCDVVQT